MNARIVTTATIFASFAGVLTARAADSQLLSLVMPDAKIIAGVNVDQAKSTPFGMLVLSQMQSNAQGMQELITLTGFDPTRDVHELLAATNGPQNHAGLGIARGNFDVTRITTLATLHNAPTEVYSGVTIIEDPKQTAGIAFLDSTLVIAGDVASVKAAIDRPHSGQALSAAVIGLVNQWSTSEDAWVVSTVSPASFKPTTAATPNMPALATNGLAFLQKVSQAAAGVRFGTTVTIKAQAQADTAQNASTMADALKMLVNMAQMQAAQSDPQLTALVQGLTIAAQGTLVNVTLTVPQAQIQQLVEHANKPAPTTVQRRVIRK